METDKICIIGKKDDNRLKSLSKILNGEKIRFVFLDEDFGKKDIKITPDELAVVTFNSFRGLIKIGCMLRKAGVQVLLVMDKRVEIRMYLLRGLFPYQLCCLRRFETIEWIIECITEVGVIDISVDEFLHACTGLGNFSKLYRIRPHNVQKYLVREKQYTRGDVKLAYVRGEITLLSAQIVAKALGCDTGAVLGCCYQEGADFIEVFTIWGR